MEDRSWMSLLNRICAEYLDGLKSFISAAEVDMLNHHKTAMWCPCIDCKNEKQYSSSSLVHAHLIIRGFMCDYRCWNKHGEEGVNDRDLQAGCMDQGFCGNLRQDDGTHAASQENEEVPFCSPELSDDKLADISANYVQKAEDLEEMVRDAMGFDECTEAELKKLKRLVADMKTQAPSSGSFFTPTSLLLTGSCTSNIAISVSPPTLRIGEFGYVSNCTGVVIHLLSLLLLSSVTLSPQILIGWFLCW
jgi:hypothetical protein